MDNDAAKCRCPRKCPPSDEPVCASNGITYKSECYMRVKACKTKKDLVVVRKGNCGKCTSIKLTKVQYLLRSSCCETTYMRKIYHRPEQFIFCQNQCRFFWKAVVHLFFYRYYDTRLWISLTSILLLHFCHGFIGLTWFFHTIIRVKRPPCKQGTQTFWLNFPRHTNKPDCFLFLGQKPLILMVVFLSSHFIRGNQGIFSHQYTNFFTLVHRSPLLLYNFRCLLL